MIENKDVQRIFNLRKQRYLQIKRDGVQVQFVQGKNLHHPSLIFNEIDKDKVSNMFQSSNQKYSLEICLESGQICYSLFKQACYFAIEYPTSIFTNNRRIQRYLDESENYYLVKVNPTLKLLEQVYDKLHQIQQQIKNFINKPDVKQLDCNPLQAEQSQIQDLNQSQQLAVKKVLYYPVSFIKGPPGCGKTKTIARICRIFSYLNKKVLVGAASNNAIKNITKQLVKDIKLKQFNPNITLFLMKQSQEQNHLHLQQVRIHTLRYKIIQKYQQINYNNDVNQNALNYYLDMYWKNSTFVPPGHFYAVYMQALNEIVNQTDIMISTTIRASKFKQKFVNSFLPFIGIIDQAAQTSWSDSLCFLINGIQKIVFVGDQKQLTPTVVSQNQQLKQTMFTTLMNKNSKYFTLLNTQYRMHPQISHFPNYQFYQGALVDGVQIKDRASQIQYFQHYPVSFINHSSQEVQNQVYIVQNQQIKNGKKKYSNPAQVKIVGAILTLFSQQILKTVGIITPYEEQLQALRKQYEQEIKQYGLSIKTCDGYQGGQKDYIIVSCVRSNQEGNLGFCKQQNRLNVTLTRARKGLILIGDANTFLNSDCQAWRNYINYLNYNGLMLSQQYLYDYVIQSNKKNRQKRKLQSQSEIEHKSENNKINNQLKENNLQRYQQQKQ